MDTILIVLSLVIVNWSVVILAPKKNIWLGANGLLLLLLSVVGVIDWSSLVCLLVFIGLLALFFGVKPIRKAILSKFIMHWFQSRLPKLSKAEEEALDTGDGWIEQSLFQGKPDWQGLSQIKLSEPSERERAFIENEVNALCLMLNDWEITHKHHDLPEFVWDYLKKNGFFGLTIDPRYGGKGFSFTAVSAIVQKIASRSFTAGVTVMVPNSLGPAELLVHFGTQPQKDRFLPRLAKGEEIPCFALTGIESGSDAANMSDIGVVCHGSHEGKNVLGVKLNFKKRYITLAPVATLIGLAFDLKDPQGLLDGVGSEGITCCYLPREHEGIEIGRRHYPCGMPIMNGPISGKNVFIPMDWLIGGQENAGRGWWLLMSCLSIGRGISLPAISQGIMTTHYLSTSAYAKVRAQFGRAIGEFEGIQSILARIAGFTYLSEACRQITATAVDQGMQPAVASAIAKYHSTEMARKVINDALDIHAGKGVMAGEKNYLLGHYQGQLISITGEGANVMTRNLIIFAQAMIRCHPFITRLILASKNKDINAFDESFWQNIGYTLNNIMCLSWYGLTYGLLSFPSGDKWLKPYYKKINFVSSAFSVAAEMSMVVLGGQLKQREQLAACLADMLSMLYLSTSVIKIATSKERTSTQEKKHATWALDYCLYQFQTAYFELIDNIPSRYIKLKLRVWAFPYGRRFKLPSHQCNQELAYMMQMPTALRAKLKDQVSIKGGELECLERLFADNKWPSQFEAFKKAIRQGEIERGFDFAQQLDKAVELKLFAKQEAKSFKVFWQEYLAVLDVDEY